MSTKNLSQFKFPTNFAGSDLRAHTWKRTYPANMKLDENDHLAVASGVLARYQEDPDGERTLLDGTKVKRFETVNGCLVEDLGGVDFNDVDIAYLDYLLGKGGYVSRQIAAYAKGEGKPRWTACAITGSWPGWMYDNLATWMAYTIRRGTDEIDADLPKSGFIPQDDSPDDGWYAGRAWGSADPDWKPGPHEAQRILDQIKKRVSKARYAKVPSGEMESPILGKVRWKAYIQIVDGAGEPVFEIPGQWIVRPGKEGLEFVDRHAWDACLWVSMELRELYTRILEKGSELIPEGDDSGLGPVAWIHDRIETLMGHLPGKNIAEKNPAIGELIQMCEKLKAACLKAAFEMEVEPEGDEFIHLKALVKTIVEEMFGLKWLPDVKVTRRRQRRTLKLSGERILIDYATAGY